MSFREVVFLFAGLQFYAVSALVYAGYLPDTLLLAAFIFPFLFTPILGSQCIERLSVVLACSSLAGLPAEGTSFELVTDPSFSLGGISYFSVLAVALALSRLAIQKHNYANLLLIALIPVLAGVLSAAEGSGSTRFVSSEFLKFIAFLGFSFYALTTPLPSPKFVRLIGILLGGIVILSIALYSGLNVGYSYGGSSYLYVPVAILIVPIVSLYKNDALYVGILFALAILLIFGYLQASAKLVVLLLAASVAVLWRKYGFPTVLLLAALAVLVPFYVYPYLPDGVRHKSMSLLILIGGQFRQLGPIFFVTSAGNILAELWTVIDILWYRYFLPLGAGFAVRDEFGLLSLANQDAYPATAFSSGFFFPFHLGAFYILLWYGVFLPILRPIVSRRLFFIAFVLTGMTYKPLLFICAFLAPIVLAQTHSELGVKGVGARRLGASSGSYG